MTWSVGHSSWWHGLLGTAVDDVVCWAQQLMTWSVGHSSWWRGLLGTAVDDVVCWAQQLTTWSVGLSNWQHGLLGWATDDMVCWAQQFTMWFVGLSSWRRGLLGWATDDMVCWAQQFTMWFVGLSNWRRCLLGSAVSHPTCPWSGGPFKSEAGAWEPHMVGCLTHALPKPLQRFHAHRWPCGRSGRHVMQSCDMQMTFLGNEGRSPSSGTSASVDQHQLTYCGSRQEELSCKFLLTV